MPHPVTLLGDVVRLEPLDPGHVDALVSAANEDRSTYAFTRVPPDAPSMRSYVESVLADQAAGLALPFATRRLDTGQVVGSTRFLDLVYWTTPPTLTSSPYVRPGTVDRTAPSTVEIGATWLAASAQRSAVNTEAKLLMLGHAFETWAVERVALKTDARNTRSRQAIERIGARFEGVHRAEQIGYDGAIRDNAYYSIIRSEWPGIRDALRRRLDISAHRSPD
ncbi:MAG: acetyltransferase [Actinomycetia bacterium]|nr:acetyltransferase [Actinomycetes bacterium]